MLILSLFLGVGCVAMYFYTSPSLPKFPSQPSSSLQLEGQIMYTPIIDGNTLFVQTTRNIYSFNLESLKEQWRFGWKCNFYDKNAFRLVNELLITTNGHDIVLALSPDTGQKIWQTDLSDGYSSGYTYDVYGDENFIYITKFTGLIYALDKDTGKLVWKAYHSDRSGAWLKEINHRLYVFSDNQILVLDPITGQVEKKISKDDFNLWYVWWSDESSIFIFNTNYPNESTTISEFDPEINLIHNFRTFPLGQVECVRGMDDKIMIGGRGIMKYDVKNGKVEWFNNETPNFSCPLVIEDVVYVRQIGGNLYSYSYETGQFQREWKMPTRVIIQQYAVVDPVQYLDKIILQTAWDRLSILDITNLSDSGVE